MPSDLVEGSKNPEQKYRKSSGKFFRFQINKKYRSPNETVERQYKEVFSLKRIKSLSKAKSFVDVKENQKQAPLRNKPLQSQKDPQKSIDTNTQQYKALHSAFVNKEGVNRKKQLLRFCKSQSNILLNNSSAKDQTQQFKTGVVKEAKQDQNVCIAHKKKKFNPFEQPYLSVLESKNDKISYMNTIENDQKQEEIKKVISFSEKIKYKSGSHRNGIGSSVSDFSQNEKQEQKKQNDQGKIHDFKNKNTAITECPEIQNLQKQISSAFASKTIDQNRVQQLQKQKERLKYETARLSQCLELQQARVLKLRQENDALVCEVARLNSSQFQMNKEKISLKNKIDQLQKEKSEAALQTKESLKDLMDVSIENIVQNSSRKISQNQKYENPFSSIGFNELSFEDCYRDVLSYFNICFHNQEAKSLKGCSKNKQLSNSALNFIDACIEVQQSQQKIEEKGSVNAADNLSSCHSRLMLQLDSLQQTIKQLIESIGILVKKSQSQEKHVDTLNGHIRRIQAENKRLCGELLEVKGSQAQVETQFMDQNNLRFCLERMQMKLLKESITNDALNSEIVKLHSKHLNDKYRGRGDAHEEEDE